METSPVSLHKNKDLREDLLSANWLIVQLSICNVVITNTREDFGTVDLVGFVGEYEV